MNRLLKHWRLTGRSEAFSAKVVAYADDFVILSRGHAHTALERLLPSVIRHTTVIIANAADSRKTAEKAALTSYRPSRPQVERVFNKIKQCRRITTRYDRLAANYLAFIKLFASNRIWLRAYESTP